MKKLIRKILTEVVSTDPSNSDTNSVNKLLSLLTPYLNNNYKIYSTCSSDSPGMWLFDRLSDASRIHSISLIDIAYDVEKQFGIDFKDVLMPVVSWANEQAKNQGMIKESKTESVVEMLSSQILDYIRSNYEVKGIHIFSKENSNYSITGLVVLQQTAMAYDLIYTTDVAIQMQHILRQWLFTNRDAKLLTNITLFLKENYENLGGGKFANKRYGVQVDWVDISHTIRNEFKTILQKDDVFDLIELSELI